MEHPARAGTRTSQPDVEKVNIPVDNLVAPQKLVFDLTFWFKWIGTTILAVVISIILYKYADYDFSYAISIQFGILAGLTSLVQWLAFQNRLGSWWIAANTAAGALLGGLQFYLKENVASIGWSAEDLAKLLAFWVIGNFVLGAILVRKAQEKSKNFSPTAPGIKSTIDFIDTGARQNIFLMLFSIYLVLAALVGFIFVLNEPGLLETAASIFYGIASILAGVSFILRKETPKNFGFIALTIFLFLDGITIELSAFNPNYPPYLLFTLSGIISLSSGIFFVSRREIWTNLGFMMVSGYLISTSLAYFGIMNLTIFNTFLIISAIFALLAAITFFRRNNT
jgi:hypothetical protein